MQKRPAETFDDSCVLLHHFKIIPRVREFKHGVEAVPLSTSVELECQESFTALPCLISSSREARGAPRRDGVRGIADPNRQNAFDHLTVLPRQSTSKIRVTV